MNTGVMLIRPNLTTYSSGLAVLEQCDFTSGRGWLETRAPAARRCRMRAGRPTTTSRARTRRRTGTPTQHVFRRRGWRHNFAAGDQGFFFYLYFVLRQAGANPGRAPGDYKRSRGLHFWGDEKPWAVPATVPSAGACPGKHPQYNWHWALRKPYIRLVPAYMYLGRLGILPANGSRCVQTLRAFRKALEAVPNCGAAQRVVPSGAAPSASRRSTRDEQVVP